MSRLRFCLLLAVICSCSHLARADAPPKPVVIPVPHEEAKEVTTLPPASVVPLETTTTPPDNTTSSTTSTTTPSTTSTTQSTTSSSTTSTTPAPKPTPPPAPGPLPPPDQGIWSFTHNNVTCIVVQFAARLNVTYTKVVENVTSLSNVILNVPANASVSGGNCTGDQWLTLSWLHPQATVANNITIVYHKNDSNKNYGVKSLNISLTPDNFVNASSSDPIELYHGAEWQTPLATSYRCKAPTRLNMSSESTSVATLTLWSLQEEAYRTAPGPGFSAARECGGGDVPDAVPIAVGCALGGLVVVVLVAYLVGRRRSAAHGYLSM